MRTQAELEAFLDQQFPEWRSYTSIVRIGEREIALHMPFRKELARAGGTVSGPALMALADRTAYYLVLALGGAMESVTSSLDIHFLARPQADVTATATVLRFGKRLAVSRVELHAGGELVAHATVTYAMPRV